MSDTGLGKAFALALFVLGAWLFLRHTLVGGFLVVTVILIVLFWGVQ